MKQNRYNEEHTISSGNRSSSIKSLREILTFDRWLANAFKSMERKGTWKLGKRTVITWICVVSPQPEEKKWRISTGRVISPHQSNRSLNCFTHSIPTDIQIGCHCLVNPNKFHKMYSKKHKVWSPPWSTHFFPTIYQLLVSTLYMITLKIRMNLIVGLCCSTQNSLQSWYILPQNLVLGRLLI